MPYLGFFDGMSIDGKEVDTSKLSEGKVIIDGEERNAEDFITDYDRLSMFEDGAIRTKRELLWQIDRLLESIQE